MRLTRRGAGAPIRRPEAVEGVAVARRLSVLVLWMPGRWRGVGGGGCFLPLLISKQKK
nr:MAG TPA: hypothetical protein [Caudoviricetes sp.]